MRQSLLDVLVDPITRTPMQIETRTVESNGELIEGSLRSSDGQPYQVTNGVPRFVQTQDPGQKQTEDSFGYKWEQRDIYDAVEPLLFSQQWLAKRYGFETLDNMRKFFAGRQRILDAGCGGGYSTSCWMENSWRANGNAEWVGADISTGIDVARDRLGSFPGTHFVQADILQLPFREQAFDTIFSEGVLHHTPSTERAFKSLIPLLAPGGEILFYVYKKKGPIREFADDYIRDVIADRDPKEAWQMLEPLTKLGQALAELHVEVEVPEDIPYLGIKAGRHDVQRLVYWHFAKMYWNENFSFEQNNHTNFDWYHPRYAYRHTEAEIRSWCEETELKIIHFDDQESGFTVRASRA